MTEAAELLDALPRHKTAHGALLADIADVLRGAPAPSTERERLSQPEELSPSELRVLRYLPTNLTRPEIARELYVSINTVNTHIRNIYSKLGARDRSSAVQRARELRLLSTARREYAEDARNHQIPASPAHQVGLQDGCVTTPPGLYMIRIRGRLGATALSAFPSMVSELKGRRPCLPACLKTGPHCSACSPRSKRSASSCSNCARSPRHRNRLNQAMAAHRNDCGSKREHHVSRRQADRGLYDVITRIRDVPLTRPRLTLRA